MLAFAGVCFLLTSVFIFTSLLSIIDISSKVSSYNEDILVMVARDEQHRLLVRFVASPSAYPVYVEYRAHDGQEM